MESTFTMASYDIYVEVGRYMFTGTLYDILCRSGKIYVYKDTARHSMSKWEDICLQGHRTTLYVEVGRHMFTATLYNILCRGEKMRVCIDNVRHFMSKWKDVSKHIKGSKYFSGQSPLSSYKTTLKQKLNIEKQWKIRWKAK